MGLEFLCWIGLVLWWVGVSLGYGDREGFFISSVDGRGLPPLVFVRQVGVTRSFGVLKLGM